MTTARTYIVRIYRRPKSGQARLAGLIEFVPSGRQRSFVSFEELRAILFTPARSLSRQGSARAAPAAGALPSYRSSKRR